MGVDMHHHRSTLKQKNKAFKSKHASKSSLKDQAKGRVVRQSPKASQQQSNASQLRSNRKNSIKQAQVKKRQALVTATRLFSGANGASRIVAVVPLTQDVSAQAASVSLVNSLNVGIDPSPETGLWKVRADRFKTSLQFIHLPYRHLYATLDACKAADYVLFVLSPSVEVEPWGETLLRTLQAQGLPHVVACSIADMIPSAIEKKEKKERTGVMKSLLSFMQYFVPSLPRIYDISSAGDCANALRALCEGVPNELRWRSGRSWLLAENISWEEKKDQDDDNGNKNTGSLHVTGVLRGAPFSVNRLVHLPGYGDFQVERIVSAPLPRVGRGTAEMEIEPIQLAAPDDDADSLVSSNVPDDLANEQTWPTEEEMRGEINDHDSEIIPDAKKGTTPRRVKRVPKGWSSYQAAWIAEDEDEEEPENDEDEDAGSDVSMDGDAPGLDLTAEGTNNEDEELDDEMEELQEAEVDISSRRSVAFQDLDIEEEGRQLEEWREKQRLEAERERNEKEDAEFPDEIDTPRDIPARTRFARYRGLRSMRTSPWDPYENLPRDYARIFQFEDYKRTERNVKRRSEAEGYGIEAGTRVTLTLRNVPQEAGLSDSAYPFVVFSLLEHEHKVSVLNFTVQRNTEYAAPVRSKEPLVLCYGPRRIRTRPIYSQHTRGGGTGVNNVHKFERWLRHGVTSLATIYGPITFGKQPCILLKETEDPQAPELVAMGTFHNTDTTRIIAKRIVLSGHPFKVHKKTATIRYMFFNSDDIAYFKPIQLYTKHGRTGHILESLGTHGYFKAHFDGPINQMDTVCMSLYKRVYPRWPEPHSENRRRIAVHYDSDLDVDTRMED